VLLLPLLLPVLLLLPLLLLLPVLLLLPLPLLLSVPAVILSAAKDPEELDAPEPSVPFNPYPLRLFRCLFSPTSHLSFPLEQRTLSRQRNDLRVTHHP
jgi:hypothetical protein